MLILSLLVVKNLLHIVIKLTFGVNCILGKTGVGVGPPLLCVGALRHLFHVRIIVLPYILKAGKDHIPMQVDRIVPQIAPCDGIQHLRPGIGVQTGIFCNHLRLEPAQLPEHHFAHKKSLPFGTKQRH